MNAKLFTDEQQTGSGQLNMVDQIERQEETLQALRTKVHIMHSSGNLEWIEVSMSDLRLIGISHLVSKSSRRTGDKVYLDANIDAPLYFQTIFPDLPNDPDWGMFTSMLSVHRREHGNNCFILSLPVYSLRLTDEA